LIENGTSFGGKDGELELLLHGEFGFLEGVSFSGKVLVGVDGEQLPFFLLHVEQLTHGVWESEDTEILEDP
jgi:hypothetical protein